MTGRFDKKSYPAAAGRERPDRRRASTRSCATSIAEQHVGSGLVAGLRVPRAYARLAAIYGLESRDLGYFTVEPTSVPQPAAPTDAQLTELHEGERRAS